MTKTHPDTPDPGKGHEGKLVGPGRLGEANDSELASDTVSGTPEQGAEFQDDPMGGRRSGRRAGESRSDGKPRDPGRSR